MRLTLEWSALDCSPDFPVLLSVYIVNLRIERGCLWGVLEDFQILKKLLCHCFFLLQWLRMSRIQS